MSPELVASGNRWSLQRPRPGLDRPGHVWLYNANPIDRDTAKEIAEALMDFVFSEEA
jgi:hypothetical protein